MEPNDPRPSVQGVFKLGGRDIEVYILDVEPEPGMRRVLWLRRVRPAPVCELGSVIRPLIGGPRLNGFPAHWPPSLRRGALRMALAVAQRAERQDGGARERG